MGFQDRLEKGAASFGAEHPNLTMVFIGLLFMWMISTAIGRLADVYRAADMGYALLGAVAAFGFNAWWAHIALRRDYQMTRAERVLIPLLTFVSTLPLVVVFEKNVLPAPAELVALSFATAFLLSGSLLMIAGWWKGRKMSPQERLREAARGHAAAFGGDPSWVDQDPIASSLVEMEHLLHKHELTAQADVLRDASSAYANDHERFQELMQSREMWGGAGAVWEVHLPSTSTNPQALTDQQRYQDAIVRLVDGLEERGLATDRARSTASTFRSWRAQRI